MKDKVTYVVIARLDRATHAVMLLFAQWHGSSDQVGR